MATTHAIPELDRNGLREFGLVTGATVVGLFGFFLPWAFGRAFPIWPWVILGVLATWAMIAPESLRPIYRAWMRVGMLFGKVTTPIVLGVTYFAVVVPVGLLMRLAKRDPLRRSFQPDAQSYRVPSETPPKNHLEKPF